MQSQDANANANIIGLTPRHPHLYLDGPGEVADVDKEGDVGAVAEVKVLIREAVLELLDAAARHDGDLLAALRTRWGPPTHIKRAVAISGVTHLESDSFIRAYL